MSRTLEQVDAALAAHEANMEAPHAPTMSQLGLIDTDNLPEGLINFYAPDGAAVQIEGVDTHAVIIALTTMSNGDIWITTTSGTGPTADAYDGLRYDSTDGWENIGPITGNAATIAVGTTTTGDAGTDAEVTNSGNQYVAVFDFVIPKGKSIDHFSWTSNSGGGSQGDAGTTDTYTAWFDAGETDSAGTLTVTNGEDGTNVLNGTVDPTTEGVDGDFYINTTSNYIFGPKATTWPSGVSLVGPQGIQGIQGIQGVQGDTGEDVDHISWTSNSNSDPQYTEGTTDTYTLWQDAGETVSLGTIGVYNGADGDMLASVYDPTSVAGDAFDRTNHHGIPTLDSALFDTAAGLSYATANVGWSDDIGGLVAGSEETDLFIPLTPTTFKVKNTGGTTITALMVVHPTGATGGNPTVSLADAASFVDSRPVGLMRSPSTGNNSVGYVTLIGPICNVDTSSWAEGTKLYLSATPGLPTSTKPSFPNYPVRVGVVTNSHATEGVVIVDSDPEHDLDQDLKIGSIPTFNVPSLNQARTEQEVKDLLYASSYYEGGAFTDNGDGTLKVATGKGFIRATDSAGAQLLSFTWAEHAAVSLTDNATNYIYVSYHATTPTINASTTKPTDSRTNVLLGKVFRDGTTVHLFKAGLNSAEFLANLIGRLTQVGGEITRASGGVISETGTRNLGSTAAVVWGGLTPVTTSSQDTSGADTFKYFYYTGTAWTYSDLSQISNLQYNNIATGLVDLASQQYGIHWIYLDPDGHQLVVYGQGSYTLDDAQNAQPPTTLPTHITQFCWLAGKAIIKKSATAFTEIQSAYDTAFTHTTASDHNGLSNLQGGAADDYYHLTAAELADTMFAANYTLTAGRIGNPLVHLPLKNDDNFITGAGSLTFTRSTTATYIDRYGVVQSAAINAARFKKEGLLIEGSSTNNLLQSEDFSSPWAASPATVTANTHVAPDGTTTGSTITGANLGNGFRYQDVTVPDDSVARTYSVFFKEGTAPSFQVRAIYMNGSSTVVILTIITWSSGVPSSTAGTLKELNNGWWRWSGTLTNDSTGHTVARCQLYPDASSSNLNTIFWGAQLEELPFASSYIPTTTTATTKAKDVNSLTHDDNIPAPEDDCTVVVDINLLGDTTNQYSWYVDTDWYLKFDSGNCVVAWGDASLSVSRGSASRFCVTFDGTTVKLYLDGVLSDSDTPTTYPSGTYTSIKVGDDLYGRESNFRIYDVVMSAEEVKIL